MLPRQLTGPGLLCMAVALPSQAAADTPALERCCEAAGLAACPSTLRVVGPGSVASREAGIWRVNGLWELECEDEAEFSAARTAAVGTEPPMGQILRGALPAPAIQCFAHRCRLPKGACVFEPQPGSYQLAQCEDGRPLAAHQWAAGSTEATPHGSPHTPGALALPPAPVGRCRTTSAQRATARRLLTEGGTSGQPPEPWLQAAQVDPCSAAAWLGLGRWAHNQGDPKGALEALRVATWLAPADPEAWTALGATQASLDQVEDARTAFGHALGLRPAHPPALAGLEALDRAP